ncbi:MAG TPA: hypothetical protein VHG93_28480 [Longimicrobium sp.]|nr:hypothetical protein [Longimicrobium sp.]
MNEPSEIPDDEILPEYTLNGGVRGKHAGLRRAPKNARVVKSSAGTGTISHAAARAAVMELMEENRRAAKP